jgi:pimeloyl-ACP methyl ester carboxylesterase
MQKTILVKFKGVAPISPVISGKLSLEGNHKDFESWKKTGWHEERSKTPPYRLKRLKWSHMEDRLKYDLLEKADKLIMPVLLIVGENDIGTPPKHQKLLFDAIPHNNKELHIIRDAPHTFVEKKHLEEIYKILTNWIKNL